jgi:hypothetical protein
MIHDRIQHLTQKSLHILENLGSGVSLVGLAFASEEVSIVKSPIVYQATSTKLLFFTVYAFAMMNGFIYSGALVSFLMVKEVNPVINNLQDILNNKEYQLMVLKGTGCEAYFKEAVRLPHAQLWNETMRGNDNALLRKRSVANEKIMEDKTNVYFETAYELSLENYPCEIMKSKASYYHIPIALPFRKDSPYRVIFGYYATTLRESGILECIGGDCKDGRGKAGDCSPSEDYMPINFGVVKIVFLLTSIGLFLSIICSVVERALYIYSQTKM